MIIIYHNPQCSKSIACFKILETSKHRFGAVKYLNEPLSEEKLRKIIKLLNIAPQELIRKNEPEWKEHYEGRELTDQETITAILRFPILMERPIVINGDKAVIGRPPEKVLSIL